LELVAYDEDLRDNRYQDGGEKPREFDEEVVVDENGEPQEDDYARYMFIDNVPDDEGEAHGHDCAAYPAEEAEDGLARS
jgi:hypothetical protein